MIHLPTEKNDLDNALPASILQESDQHHEDSMIKDFESWKAEILFTGNIIQDGDNSVDPGERHRRFMRFVEMVDALTGNEGPLAVDSLFESIQVNYSYGAYHSINHALARFPEMEYLSGLVRALPRLIESLPDQAGEHLVSVANGMGGKWEYQIGIFNRIVAESSADVRASIISFVREQETNGWLDHRVGVLCPF